MIIIVDDDWAEANNLPTDIPFIVADIETPNVARAMYREPLVQSTPPDSAYIIIDIEQLGRPETRAGVPLSAVEIYFKAGLSVDIVYSFLSEFIDKEAIEDVSDVYDELSELNDWDDDEDGEEGYDEDEDWDDIGDEEDEEDEDKKEIIISGDN